MALTPVEVKHVRFSRRPFGYRRASVEPALLEVADSFEEVWRSRADAADRVEAPRGRARAAQGARGAAPHDARLAERTAAELKEQAKREAEPRGRGGPRRRPGRCCARRRPSASGSSGSRGGSALLLRSALDAVEETGEDERASRPPSAGKQRGRGVRSEGDALGAVAPAGRSGCEADGLRGPVRRRLEGPRRGAARARRGGTAPSSSSSRVRWTFPSEPSRSFRARRPVTRSWSSPASTPASSTAAWLRRRRRIRPDEHRHRALPRYSSRSAAAWLRPSRTWAPRARARSRTRRAS